MFVSKEEIPVTIDNENFIVIKAKLNYGEKMRVQRAALSMKANDKKEFDTELDVAGYQTALLIESIVRWYGPLFAGRVCNAASVLELDPDAPLVNRVIEEIATRNNKDTASPKAASPDGDALLTVMQSR